MNFNSEILKRISCPFFDESSKIKVIFYDNAIGLFE